MADEKNKTKEEPEDCVWDMGTPCDDGPVERQLMFEKQLHVPICNKHMEEHREVMILVAAGHPIDEVVEMTAEERKRQAILVALSGMDLTDVEV